MKLNDATNKNRYERKKEETRQKIINIAMNLFNEQGFETTTLEQIAEKADIARKTLYNHFPVKEEIVCEYMQRFMSEREPEIYRLIQQSPDTRARLVAVLNKTMDWVKIAKDYCKIIVYYRLSLFKASAKIQRSGIHIFMAEIIRLGQEKGEIRGDLPCEMLVSQVDNIRLTTAVGWFKNQDDFPVQDYIAKSVDLFLYGAVDRSGNGN